ncbi:uncharacterized protein EURHEDRAFT_415267 [Aspergillus ruber CBS 135680]|uniref:Zinc knuckle-domain-containing protein n=1 Tax=Aspergillus ruber (strain CBS 135680) TaxID=1388766 RepID=A0A017S6C2_ASPRC|nr:uncharacterized protein EURHEDRAFT_415267 [Aspergillus ruber CBS 135680]EYE92502.1 hypothetical protein EURHEDRAFT_415267 [Aspergillus ruber CBS 135680]
MNNRYRNAPGLRGPTKASASTLCQKCLKRGHYSYECTASAQERPYLARPSRTQQLQNPKLRPKLSSDTPNDLLRTEDLADKLLTKREEERGRKRDNDVLDRVESRVQSPRRSRTESAHSMSSISTISTSRSQSRSPPRHGDDDRTGSRHSRTRKRHYSDSSSGRSVSPYSSGEKARSRSREWARDRNTRRRRRESSPAERGRSANLSRDSRQKYRSRSRDRDQIARGRRSLTPHHRRRSRDAAPPEPSQNRASGRRSGYEPDYSAAQPPRNRSLSPFSKRLALTQAMNMGR